MAQERYRGLGTDSGPTSLNIRHDHVRGVPHAARLVHLRIPSVRPVLHHAVRHGHAPGRRPGRAAHPGRQPPRRDPCRA